MPVDSVAQELKDVAPKLDLVGALWGGTETMRKAGQAYLPKEPAEDQQDYNRRLSMSFLTNFFKKTVKVMAGRLFEDKVTIADAPAFEAMAENVDMEGRNLHRFGYDFTQLTIRDGIRFIVVDAPPAIGVTNLNEERQAGIRPYFVEVDVRNVLGIKTIEINGRVEITQFRYKEWVAEDVDKFTTESIEQIRVIEPKTITLYRKNKAKEWVIHGEPLKTSIDFVPVVPVYAGRQGFLEFTPPLTDLAWLNVEHWQKSSDQSNILHVARVPILHWAGYSPQMDANGNMVDLMIGPNTLAKSASEKAKLEYVEHSGAAIGAGRQDLMDIEARAVAMGADFATPRKSGDMTATEAAIGEAGDVSDLSATAQNIKDSFELAFMYAGKMTKTEFTGTVTMNTDLGIINTPINIPELIKLRMTRDISRIGLFEVLNKEWDTTLDAETEAERIAAEPNISSGDFGDDE